MPQALKIAIACGGTGGHLFPGIAVAKTLRSRGHETLLLISRKQVDADASAKYSDLRFESIAAIAKPPTFSLRMIPFLWRLAQSIRHSRRLLHDFGADAVLGMGGFTSLPPVAAASQAGLPSFVHDSNARPGRASILIGRRCHSVFLGFKEAAAFFPGKQTLVTGTPARPEILSLPDRRRAAAQFGLNPDRPVVLITGGSQGARRLNELAAEAIRILPPDAQALHIAGNADLARTQEVSAGRPGHVVMGFCDQMPAAYAAADLVIARAGASSLTEIALAGLPAILVPYPYAADDHQTLNAQAFANAGAAEIVQERDLDARKLADITAEILNNNRKKETMTQAARSMAIPDAAEKICRAIENILQKNKTHSANKPELG